MSTSEDSSIPSLSRKPSSSALVQTPATNLSSESLIHGIDRGHLGLRNIATTNRNNKYVLVTGGLGFIGSHTSVELLKAGYSVLIIDDLSNSYAEALDGIKTIARIHYDKIGLQDKHCPSVEFHNMSFRDIPAMRELLLGSFGGEETSVSMSASSPSGGSVRRAMTRADNIVGVIHFAAHKAVEESIRQPIKYYQNNINGLVDFMGLLDECGIKNVIFSSSAAVYGALADGTRLLREENCILHNEAAQLYHQQQQHQDGDDGLEMKKLSSSPSLSSSLSSSSLWSAFRPVTPISAPPPERLPQSGCVDITNPYGRTKYFGEAILADLVASDPSWNVVVLRYFNPVGCDASGLLAENPKGVPSNLFPVVVQVMMGQRRELYVYGDDWDTPDGTAVRDFVHVTDIARGHTAALAAALEGRVRGGGFRTFNLGAGTGNSVLDVVNTMEAASGRRIPLKIVGRRPGDVQSSIAAVNRASAELGWKPQESLFSACRDICNRLKIGKY